MEPLFVFPIDDKRYIYLFSNVEKRLDFYFMQRGHGEDDVRFVYVKENHVYYGDYILPHDIEDSFWGDWKRAFQFAKDQGLIG